MQPHLLLLDSTTTRLLHRRGRDHHDYLYIQLVHRPLRLHICVAANRHDLEVEHEQAKQSRSYSHHAHGMRVRTLFPCLDPGDTANLPRYSASAAVVVRFGYVKDFKNPDFLCTYSHYNGVSRNHFADLALGATLDIAIWSTVEGGLGITAGSLATLRPLFRIIGPKFGLSTRGPSILQDSDGPRGFRGDSEGSRGRKKDGDLFSLTAFKGRNESGKATLRETGNEGVRDISMGKYDSSRVKQEKTQSNESEEELVMA